MKVTTKVGYKVKGKDGAHNADLLNSLKKLDSFELAGFKENQQSHQQIKRSIATRISA